MAWKYEQSTGKLYSGTERIETGYSGNLTNKNNPDRQHVSGMGPIPRGTYHGERVGQPAGFASAGCIIMSLSTRRRVLREGGTLEVVR